MTYDPSQPAGPFNPPPTPFHDAAERGDVEALRRMIAAGADVNEEDWTGRPPLSRAVDGGASTEAVRLLLEAGADANGGDTFARPFVEAAYRDRADVMRLLLEFGARPDAPDEENGETALIPAAYRGNLAMVEWLLGLGVSPNVVARKGITALSAAREGGHDAIVARLRAAGASEPRDTNETG